MFKCANKHTHRILMIVLFPMTLVVDICFDWWMAEQFQEGFKCDYFGQCKSKVQSMDTNAKKPFEIDGERVKAWMNEKNERVNGKRDKEMCTCKWVNKKTKFYVCEFAYM